MLGVQVVGEKLNVNGDPVPALALKESGFGVLAGAVLVAVIMLVAVPPVVIVLSPSEDSEAAKGISGVVKVLPG